MELCPCCSNKNYSECCQPYLTERSVPLSPEALMRSRYTAYTQANYDYILNTMKPPALEKFNVKNSRKKSQQVNWTQLQVITVNQVSTIKAYVEFIAYYQHQQSMYKLHEKSEFHFEEGRWFYMDGEFLTD